MMAEVFDESVGVVSEGTVSALLGRTKLWAVAWIHDVRPIAGVIAHQRRGIGGKPAMRTRAALVVLIVASLCGCRSQDSAAITHNILRSERRAVALSAAVPGDWDRVCILGPYTDNEKAAQTLGFPWAAETLTDIHQNDGMSVLVFARGNAVVKHVEHPRGSGDFSSLSGRCFPKARARFVQVIPPGNGWPGLVPADGS